MGIHKNARLTFRSREDLVKRVAGGVTRTLADESSGLGCLRDRGSPTFIRRMSQSLTRSVPRPICFSPRPDRTMGVAPACVL
jgi:hypothetical protein